MKARTKVILAAADRLARPDDLGRFGVCCAMETFNANHAMNFFIHWFHPPFDNGIDGRVGWWLGNNTEENYQRRLTFIAMAAAVSETED